MLSTALRACSLLLASFALSIPAALAQSYPAKPLRLIVPFSAGGSSDVLARGVAKQLGEQLGEPVVVENRAGAGGMIALEFVAKTPADGYTLLFGTIGTNGIGPALYKNLAFDPVKDLAPVSSLHTLPNVLLVNAAVPARTVAELIALAKARPAQLTFASAGSGSGSHRRGIEQRAGEGGARPRLREADDGAGRGGDQLDAAGARRVRRVRGGQMGTRHPRVRRAGGMKALLRPWPEGFAARPTLTLC